MSARRRIVVVGGGITGLAAAHRVLERAREGAPVDVVLLEASARLGGAIGTDRTGDFLIERGADSMLTEKPWGVSLCERLGIADRLVGTRPESRGTSVVYRGQLEPVPEGFLLMAPTDLRAVLASPLFSWKGKLRMGLDLVLPRGRRGRDETLAHFVRRRLGREVLERVAQPLAGGIYTGDAEALSVAATMPRFVDIERRHRSLIRGLRRAAREGSAGGAGARHGLFVAPIDGMGALVDALARRLPEGAVRVRAPVTGLGREGAEWRIRAGDETFTADRVVLAAPAYVAGTLVRALDARLADLLDAIPYASSATITCAYRSANVPRLSGSGFVVPSVERRPLLACTYSSRKYPRRAPEDHELLRCFVGGVLRPDIYELEDRDLVATVRNEMWALVGARERPLLARVARYPRSMPQYNVGHLERVAMIDARVRALPGLALAGAAYRGVGIPDCIRDGEAAAEQIV